MNRQINKKLHELDSSLQTPQKDENKLNSLLHKWKIFTAITAVTLSSILMTSCKNKSDFEKASDNYIEAEDELREATQEKKEANKHYKDALENFYDAKQDLKQETNKL